MLKSDLRVGNYVYDNGIIRKVYELTDNYCGFQKYGILSSSEILVPYTMLQPIEINEEILIKAGFKKFTNNVFNKELFSYDLEVNYILNGYEFKQIKYVHELQNWYFNTFKKELTKNNSIENQ